MDDEIFDVRDVGQAHDGISCLQCRAAHDDDDICHVHDVGEHMMA